jgi:aconitate hydratase
VIEILDGGIYLIEGKEIIPDNLNDIEKLKAYFGEDIPTKEEAIKNTIAYSIIENHNKSDNMDKLKLQFDELTSHDLTYVGIIQTARASGLEKFPMPYTLTNCHNSLCAVGGTINADDHAFGLSAAVKYGGIYVPPHQAVIHQYMREMSAGCGKMILGSDSHTRYGALGTLAIGEGGPELVKQLLNKTYDIDRPEVIGVYLTGKPQNGVGPQDVALAIIGDVFEKGFVKNKIMEFVGDGVSGLNIDYRNGIDVMTTETTCLSSIWITDDRVKDYLKIHGREEQYKQLSPGRVAYYEGMVYVDLSKIKPMIALPFHPSNVYTIEELNSNLHDIFDLVEKNGRKQLENPKVKFSLKDKIINNQLFVEQGIIAGCAGGTYDNICDVADFLANNSIGENEFSLSVYPSSQAVYLNLVDNGSMNKIIKSGAIMKTAFCGPCFGAGDTPANNGLSIRHTTRNFPNREGSKITNGQIASVALMDARSIAATAINKGKLTAATDIDISYTKPKYSFDEEIYNKRIYFGYKNEKQDSDLRFGPNIVDWPEMSELTEDLLLKVASVIHDPVTTTDELIPSGETSSYRSNPLGLAEFTLSRKDPEYVGRAKQIHKIESLRLNGEDPSEATKELKDIYDTINGKIKKVNPMEVGLGSVIYAVKPGDGSAREQAASCQRVLGGWANISVEYATKRYRSNLINWGMIPFVFKDELPFKNDDYLFIPELKRSIETREEKIKAYVVREGNIIEFCLELPKLTEDEINIILSGSLINFYRKTL